MIPPINSRPVRCPMKACLVCSEEAFDLPSARGIMRPTEGNFETLEREL